MDTSQFWIKSDRNNWTLAGGSFTNSFDVYLGRKSRNMYFSARCLEDETWGQRERGGGNSTIYDHNIFRLGGTGFRKRK
jgi:hypothetical protein